MEQILQKSLFKTLLLTIIAVFLTTINNFGRNEKATTTFLEGLNRVENKEASRLDLEYNHTANDITDKCLNEVYCDKENLPFHKDNNKSNLLTIEKEPAQTAIIGNQVWNDLNRNGFRDAGEPGIKDITVKLRTLDNHTVMLIPTDENGNYRFTNVEPGTYRIMFVIPSILGTLKPSKATGFGKSNIDNDNDINSDNITDELTFSVGENNQTIDAGFYIESTTSKIRVEDASIKEDAEKGSVRICLDKVISQAVTVEFNSVNGTAQLGADYATVAGTATIPAGEICKEIDILVLDDDIDEANETFKINLSNPINATIVDNQAEITIIDNDTAIPSNTCIDITVAASAGKVDVFKIPKEAKLEITGTGTAWKPQLICNGDCDSWLDVKNLVPGYYNIKAQVFDPYCFVQIDFVIKEGAVDPCAEHGGDSDGDGVCNAVDNCPEIANPDQKDSNNNGIGDVCEIDPCAEHGGDSDGDGVCDAVDNCPEIANPDQKDSNNNGIGDVCEVDP
jgi:hypothetical protein